jgi:multidrug efflux pump subunit AcrA (membrane-fusion protein)
VAVDAVPDRRYQGRLREIIPMGDRTRGIVKVKVSILDPDERLFPELSATVHFLPDQTEEESSQAAEKGVFVPEAAIQGEGDDQYVWLLDETRVRKTAVTPQGEPNDGVVRVAGELEGGERVVVDPPAGLQAGDEVTIAE